MSTLGRMRLISHLEGIVSDNIHNNYDAPIRYPITLDDSKELRGRQVILKVDELEWDELMKGKYVFGANKLYIYKALNQIIDYLNNKLLDYDMNVEILCDAMEYYDYEY